MIHDYNNLYQRFSSRIMDELGDHRDFTFKYYDCPCGGAEYKIISTTTRHHNHFDTVQCRRCGTLRINPYLTDESLDKYYKDVYGPVKRQGATTEELYNRQKKGAEKLLSVLKEFLTPDKLVLDFGGGAGGRMDSIRREGFEVYIRDSDAKYEAYALDRGLKKYDETKKYDMVVLSHVLEHINDPVGFLKYAASTLISERGLIYIELPLIENTKKQYLLRDLHISHKFYFSALSLRHIVESAGYEIVKDVHNGVIARPSTAAARPYSSTEMMALSDGVVRAAQRKACLYSLKKQTLGRIKKLFKS